MPQRLRQQFTFRCLFAKLLPRRHDVACERPGQIAGPLLGQLERAQLHEPLVARSACSTIRR